MIDDHLHLVPHGERRRFSVDDVRAYALAAGAAGLDSIAVTEHLYRFPDVQDAVGAWWEVDPDLRLREQTAGYFAAERLEQTLPEYVDVVGAAAGDLPPGAASVRLGLEVDYLPERMDVVADLLAPHPFDVLLGSVHWVGAWGLDQIGDPVVTAEWERRHPDDLWAAYVACVEAMAATGACDVLAHVDLAKLTGVRPLETATECDERLVAAAVRHGLAVEINTAGWRKPVREAYPAPALLQRFHTAGVGITLASDAHDHSMVADRLPEAVTLASEAGYESLLVHRGRRPRPVPLRVPEGA